MGGIRYDKRIRQRVCVHFGADDLANVGFTEDISESGIFLKSARVFPVSSELRVEMTTDDDYTIRFIGEVKYSKQVAPNLVWVDRDAGMGIHIRRFVAGREYFDQLLIRSKH